MKLKTKKCKVCGKNFLPYRSTDKHCSFTCFYKDKKPVAKKKSKIKQFSDKQIYDKNRLANIAQNYKDNDGYNNCQYCKQTGLGETHHIVSRSKVQSHPQKHCKLNLILVCRECHRLLENDIEKTNELIIDRNLEIIFDQKLLRY